jgi:hypothetical protein
MYVHATGTFVTRGIHAVRHRYLYTSGVVLVAYSCTLRVAKVCMPRMAIFLVAPVGGEGGRRSRHKWRWCLHEQEHMIAYWDFLWQDVYTSKACHTHGLHAKLGQTHVWVGIYPFESNRVSLGPNQVGFGPGLCWGCPNPFKYPWGAPLFPQTMFN